MARRPKRAATSIDELSAKGVPVAIGGLVLVVVPVLGGSLRPLGWILLSLGLFLIAIPQLLKGAKGKLEEVAKKDQASGATKDARPDSKEFLTAGPFGRIEPDWGRDIPNPSKSKIDDLRPRQLAWGPAVFKDIEWRRFESVCEALFAQAGFTTKSQSHGPDGGVDIWLYSRHAEGAVAVVQCKHWQSQVGVKELREFFGVMASNKLKRGTFATSSTFTDDARKFAKDNGINALDCTALLSQIATRTTDQQRHLLDVAYEGEYWRPTCASCGVKLLDRKKFWGCTNYPRCKTKIWKSVVTSQA